MDALTRAGFIAHAQSAGYQRRLGTTIALLRAELDDRSYVSFSAGKDSSVIAHLCHAIRSDIPVLMVDPGCPTHWLEGERLAWTAYAEAFGWQLVLFPWDKWREVSAARTIAEHRRLAHAGMFADLHAWAAAHGLDQRVMGMRSEESPQRAILGATRGPSYVLADGTRALNPIIDWRVADVWAYILTHRLPWLTIYDHLGPAARNGLIGRSGATHGRLAWLKLHYPDAYLLARTLMPIEAAQYA